MGACYNKNNRLHIIDCIRGCAITAVVIYHIMYDIDSIFFTDYSFIDSAVLNILRFISYTTLIVVSGICTAFSRNIFRRAGMLIIVGECVTITTSLIGPQYTVIFGAVSLLGFSMLIYGLCCNWLKRIPWKILLCIALCLYIVFSVAGFSYGLNIGADRKYCWLYPFGMITDGFFSADYFPLIPYFFLFLAGTAVSVPVTEHKRNNWFYNANCKVLELAGRNSLLIYILHQPIVFGLLYFVSLMIK